MARELQKHKGVELAFEPAQLELKNYDEMENRVETFSEKYENLVFDSDDKKGLTQARSELLELKNALEDERKQVKSVYNEPLKEFESKMKGLTDLIDEPLEKIRDGIKAINQKEKEEREKALNEFLEGLIADSDVSIDEIEYGDKWLNKGNWTDDLEPKGGQFETELENAVQDVIDRKKKREREKEILVSFCENNDIDPSGWLVQLEFKDAMEIIDDINKFREFEKSKNEASEVSDDSEGKHSSETEKPVRSENNGQIDDDSDDSEVITNTIEVTGTVSQLNELNKFLVDSDIRVTLVSG